MPDMNILCRHSSEIDEMTEKSERLEQLSLFSRFLPEIQSFSLIMDLGENIGEGRHFYEYRKDFLQSKKMQQMFDYDYTLFIFLLKFLSEI